MEGALRFVPDGAGPPEPDLNLIRSRLDSLLALRHGIKIEAMPVLVPAASGKFRLTSRSAPVEVADKRA